jgi:hypothetical protein
MKKNNVHKEIVVYKNFLTNEEIHLIMKECLSSLQSDWHGIESEKIYSLIKNNSNLTKKFDRHVEKWDKTKYQIKNNDFLNGIKNKIDSICENGYIASDDYKIVNKFSDGRDMDVHHDAVLDSSIKFGAVIYLNDNYQGGEIFYPELDFKYKPSAGDLIIHPAKDEYKHGVNKVFNGNRYSIAFFIKI